MRNRRIKDHRPDDLFVPTPMDEAEKKWADEEFKRIVISFMPGYLLLMVAVVLLVWMIPVDYLVEYYNAR